MARIIDFIGVMSCVPVPLKDSFNVDWHSYVIIFRRSFVTQVNQRDKYGNVPILSLGVISLMSKGAT